MTTDIKHRILVDLTQPGFPLRVFTVPVRVLESHGDTAFMIEYISDYAFLPGTREIVSSEMLADKSQYVFEYFS